jgi:hypothetical protein
MENFPDHEEGKLVAHTQNELIRQRQTWNDSSKLYIFAAQRIVWRRLSQGIPFIPDFHEQFLFYEF